MTTPGDLIAFLRARYDEIETAAKNAASVAGPDWKSETYWPDDESTTRTIVRSADGAYLADFWDTPDYPNLATHVAMQDPGLALRSVAGKRKIVDMAEEQDGWDLPEGVADGRDPDEHASDEALRLMLVEVLHHLAEEFATHPDYNARMWGPLGSGNPVPE